MLCSEGFLTVLNTVISELIVNIIYYIIINIGKFTIGKKYINGIYIINQ